MTRALQIACAAKWSLSLGAPYANSSHSCVIRVSQADGSPAVLKLSFSTAETRREADALKAFAGHGAVAVLAYDEPTGAMLLERAEPGYPLAQLCETDDERATSIAAGVICALHRAFPDDLSFPAMETWQSDLHRIPRQVELTPLLRTLVSDALAVFAELNASPSHQLLLHGDLHQFNILAHGESWLVIDPKGVIGEAECEIAPLILNPMALLRRSNLSRLIDKRIDQLCEEAALDRPRARRWTFVRTVLAILWDLEDHGEASAEWIECARLLRRVL